MHSDGTIDGVEATIKNTLLYAYYGGSISAATPHRYQRHQLIGYGYHGSSNSQNRAINEVTFGFNQTMWKNPRYGAINLMGQYEWLERDPWYVATGAPKNTHDNTDLLQYSVLAARLLCRTSKQFVTQLKQWGGTLRVVHPFFDDLEERKKRMKKIIAAGYRRACRACARFRRSARPSTRRARPSRPPFIRSGSANIKKAHPDVQINYQPIGSGGGIRQLTDGTVDFGASDMPMTDEQIGKHEGQSPCIFRPCWAAS